jgi:hypothetical protein
METALPGRFVFFSEPPPVLEVGASLTDLAFEVWRQGYGGWAYPGRVEGSGKIQPVKSGGEVDQRALPTIPPTKGLTLVTWAVHLPSDAASLEFRVGLADPSPPLPPTIEYSGVMFLMNINGESLWSQEVRQNGWQAHKVDVSKWQGKDVVIQIGVDAQSNAIFDWAHWAGLTLR